MLGAAVPIERTGARAARRSRGTRDLDAPDRIPRRPAVRSRRHGWLRRPRRRHVRRGTLRLRTLDCVDKVFTGQVPSRSIQTGQCVEIATGAPLPDGADAVVMVEETERVDGDGANPCLLAGLSAAERRPPWRGHHRRSDHRAARRSADPGRLGALAAIGAADVDVFARPRVAILSTGNEIVAPGRRSGPDRSTTSTASRCRRSWRHTAACRSPSRTAPDTLEALSRRSIGPCRERHGRLFRRQLRRRTRSDHRRPQPPRRDRVSWHRREARQAHGLRTDRRHAGARHAGISDVLSVERVHAARPHVAQDRAPAGIPSAVARLPLARRIVSTTGRHQFYTVRHRRRRSASRPSRRPATSPACRSPMAIIEIPAHADIVEAGELVDVKLF